MDTPSQNRVVDRDPVASGRFYSAGRDTLLRDVSLLFEKSIKTSQGLKVRALISPHAGYVFSGRIAASAFSAVGKEASYKNIFLVGSSHIMAFEGASAYDIGDFKTPLGKVTVNREIAFSLKNENKVFSFPVNAHLQEHSLEVQLPFIQYYFENQPPIIPIIIGTSNHLIIKKIAQALESYFSGENLFVISSDFSHYPSYENANETDRLTASAILTGQPKIFTETLKRNSEKRIEGLVTSMCGWTSGLTLMYLAEGNPDLEFRHIGYCNSGDSPYGSKDGVVGYHAIELIEKL
jgi:AmmeMemoRadiSam system protein B